jgi:hypothetical protein
VNAACNETLVCTNILEIKDGGKYLYRIRWKRQYNIDVAICADHWGTEWQTKKITGEKRQGCNDSSSSVVVHTEAK